jgi:hypothetical protein
MAYCFLFREKKKKMQLILDSMTIYFCLARSTNLLLDLKAFTAATIAHTMRIQDKAQ